MPTPFPPLGMSTIEEVWNHHTHHFVTARVTEIGEKGFLVAVIRGTTDESRGREPDNKRIGEVLYLPKKVLQRTAGPNVNFDMTMANVEAGTIFELGWRPLAAPFNNAVSKDGLKRAFQTPKRQVRRWTTKIDPEIAIRAKAAREAAERQAYIDAQIANPNFGLF